MGTPPDSGGSPLAPAVPFVLVLAIFYFIILLPMQRKQQKVQDFLDGAEGRRQGRHDRRHLRPDHPAQRADRSAPDCRQGPHRGRARRHRRLPGPGAGRRAGPRRKRQISEPNLALESHDLVAGRRSSPRRRLSDASPVAGRSRRRSRTKQLQARPRPQGRRASRAARADRRRTPAADRDGRWSGCARRSTTANITVARPRRDAARRVRGGGRPAGRRTPHSGQAAAESQTDYDRSAGRQRRLHLHDEAERRQSAARRGRRAGAETIERRVNELGVTEPSIAQQGANGDQILVAAARCHRRQPREGDHQLDRRSSS